MPSPEPSQESKPTGPTELIPLFPLGAVLFPGLVLPLHIFEQRYQELVTDVEAMPEGQQEFGVVAIKLGREVGSDGIKALHAVGCTAALREIDKYPDGRSDLVTVGHRRFVIHSLVESKPYLQARVSWLPEEPGEAAEVLQNSVARRFVQYRQMLLAARGLELAQPDEIPDSAEILSYLVAAATILDLADRQRLLAAPTTTERLRAELDLLRSEVGLLRAIPSVPGGEYARASYVPN